MHTESFLKMRSGGIELLNLDNLEYMSGFPDDCFDLAIVDPQTGQDEGKRHASRPYTVKQSNGTKLRIERTHKVKEWDNAPPTQEYWNQLFRITKHQIILCENYLHFDQKKNSAGRIIWNLLRDNDFSACQIMWTDLFQKIEYFEYLWSGMMQGTGINQRTQKGNKALNEKRIHPSQKPIIVYRHLLKQYAKPGWKIFDSHLGSGSLPIACYEEGYECTATEIDTDIYNDTVKRFTDYIGQSSLFVPSAVGHF
jgi:site-specific DNA-methyltransferase (adenine-specific)